DPLINAKIPHYGFPVFAFEFHFPYFALRKHRLPRKDSRRSANGDMLRQYQDVTFLRTMENKSDNSFTEYVYEAKLSCLVSGVNRYKWSAYVFNDLYFETDEYTESVEEYHEQAGLGLMIDPLTGGKRHRAMLPCDPRENFLLIFEVRLRMINKEWRQLYVAVAEAIRSYRAEYWTKTSRATSRGHGDQSVRSSAGITRSQLQEEVQEWIMRSVELLGKFIHSLDQYSEEWAMFRDTGSNYFMSANDPELSCRLRWSLTAAEQQVTDLGRLLIKFKHTMDCLREDMPRDINLRIAHENKESALFQQKTSRDVNVLTWITFLSLPFALSTSLLSTQEGYFPFTPSPWVLLASITILEALVWFALGSLLGWHWLKLKLKWRRNQLSSADDIDGSQYNEGLG
ncbi:hypothetical protein F5Y04DRAFT_287887, partial [Hypomontagnella monticulosa]